MLYSIVLVPPAAIVAGLKKMKHRLKEQIGVHANTESMGHITICEFQVGEDGLAEWQEKLMNFVEEMASFTLCFDRIEVPSGGIFLEPERASLIALNSFIQKFYKSTPTIPCWKTTAPHICVARQLTPFQVAMARKVLRPMQVHLTFDCSHLSLKKFNETRGQFETQQIFSLNGVELPETCVNQLALF